MQTTVGIVVLAICAIGALSVLSWVFKQVAKLLKPHMAGASMKVGRYEEYLGKSTSWDDLPKYKGRTWFMGLPHYQDVMIPNKHNYATVVYMDHPFKQWVYDVMCNWKSTCDGFQKDGIFKSWIYVLFFPLAALFAGAPFIATMSVTLAVAIIFIFWTGSIRAERRMAENTRNLKPDDWRKVYKEVAETKEREDEMVRALRRSGVRRL